MCSALAFRSLIEYLDDMQIRYAILGNTNSYPEKIESDVDFIVSTETYRNLEKYITDFCRLNNFTIFQKIEHESTACYFVLGQFDRITNNYFFFQLDFCHEFIRHGRFFLNSNELLQNIYLHKSSVNFYRLNADYEFIYYFIKRIDKSKLESEHFEHLKNCWKTSNSEIRLLVSRFFSPETADKVDQIFATGDFHLLSLSIIDLKKTLRQKNKVAPKYRLLDFKRTIKRITNKTGLVVAILGCDGTGKSTLINGLESNLKLCYRLIEKKHLYPGLFLGTKRPEDISHDDPHSNTPRNTLMSSLKLLFFFIEYFLGYWIKIYPKKVSSGLILFDRYFVDLFVDPKRYRHNGSGKLVWLVHQLIPKPDIWIILDAPTETVLKRKQEVTYTESERQRKKYKELESKLKNAFLVDAMFSPGEMLNNASGHILDTMHRKLYN
jgi:thymidylate kinase